MRRSALVATVFGVGVFILYGFERGKEVSSQSEHQNLRNAALERNILALQLKEQELLTQYSEDSAVVQKIRQQILMTERRLTTPPAPGQAKDQIERFQLHSVEGARVFRIDTMTGECWLHSVRSVSNVAGGVWNKVAEKPEPVEKKY